MRAQSDPCNRAVYCYYRCIGTDAHRLDGHSVSDNPQIQGDYLEQAVWDRMRALLDKRTAITHALSSAGSGG